MPIHLRELPKGQRFVLTRTGDKFAYLGVGVSPEPETSTECLSRLLRSNRD